MSKHYVLTNVTAAVFNSPPPPPPPPPHPLPAPPPSRRDRTSVWVRRHPWATGIILIALTYIVGRIVWNIAADHRALRVHLFIVAIFWFLAIGTIPIVAIFRTVGNAADKVFDND